MKTLVLALLIFGAFTVQAQQKQSLKDLLYSGKLKKDSSGVIRSTDDLSSKIDTTTKKVPDPVKPEPAKPQPVATVQAKQPAVIKADTAAALNNTVTETKDNTVATDVAPIAAPVAAATPATGTAGKTNTKLWKEYTDTLMKILKAEVLNSKQIKKNTYFLMVDYEIGTDGQVTVTNVSSEPANAFLQAQVKQVMDSTPLLLNPVLDSANQPKKVKKKQQITITKD